jgi:DNA-nicking Smr family endonuclease
MSRKSKTDGVDQGNDWAEQNKAFSNKPFEGLARDLTAADKGEEPPSSPVSVDSTGEQSEVDLFRLAMKGVVPVKDNKKKIIGRPVRKDKPSNRSAGHSKDVREYLSSLVNESVAWDISFSDEYMEGAVSGVGSKIMKKLKRGEFSIQDYIDLHGLTRAGAETVVTNFITQSYQRGLRCVLIVHGRGLGSVDHQPAIKKELPVWFKRGILKKIVLAFVTARQCDGGAGALYVLLKKR